MIITPQAPQPSSQNREDEALIKANENLDDDSRHWPKETETFATSECTRISNEDLGKFHADLEAGGCAFCDNFKNIENSDGRYRAKR